MSPETQTIATIDDLYRVEGKAELVGGRIIHLMPTGHRPGRIAFKIAQSLDAFAEATARGVAYPDNIGFRVRELSSGRQTFSPDAAYYLGTLPANLMRFIDGPPTFAVEVRSENDYGPTAEEELSAKRADYFEAGTKVVWDVDPEAEIIHVYRADASDRPQVLHRGDVADAEPAVEGWRIDVDCIFGPAINDAGQIT